MVVRKLSVNEAIQVINKLLPFSEDSKEWIPLFNKDDSESVSLILKCYHKWLINNVYNESLNSSNSHQAIEFYFLELLSKNQGLPSVHYSLGEIYFISKDWAKAKYYWSLVPEESALGSWVKMHLAEMIIIENKLNNRIANQEAIKIFELLIESKDNIIRAEAYWNLYILYLNNNDLNNADRYLVELKNHLPDYRMVNLKYIDRLKELNNVEEAFKFCCDEYIRTKDIYWSLELIQFFEKIDLEKVNTLISFYKLKNILGQLIKQFEYEEWCKILGLIVGKFILDESQYIELLKEILSVLKKINENNFYKIPTLKEMSRYVEILYLKYQNNYIPFETRKNIEIPLLYKCLLLSKYFEVIPFHYECANRLLAWQKVSKDKIITNDIIELAKRPFINPQCLQRVDSLPEKIYPWNEITFQLEGIAKHSNLHFDEKEMLLWKGHYPFYSLFITGIFSTGKSTMINKLIGEKILKTKILPTTASMIWLKPGQKISYDKIEFNQEIEFTEITEESFNSLTTFGVNIDDNSLIPYSQVTLPSSFLEHNTLSLTDTPGFEDLNTDTSESLLSQFRLSDGLIFLLDATKPLTSVEADYIQKINEIIQPAKINFILNKTDLIDEDELDEIHEYVLKALTEILNYTPKILLYSNQTGDVEELKKFIQSEIPKDILQLHYNNYEKIVQNIILDWKVLLNNQINEFEESCNEIEEKKETVIQLNKVLQDETNDLNNYINESLRNVGKKIESITVNGISDILGSKKNSVVRMFSDSDNIRSNVNVRLKNDINDWIKGNFITLKRELLESWENDVGQVLDNYFVLIKTQQKSRGNIFGEESIMKLKR